MLVNTTSDGGVRSPALTLGCCVSLSELLNLSGPQFSPLIMIWLMGLHLLTPSYLSQVSASGKLFTRRKVRLRNLSSLVAEWMLHEELRSSFSAWLRLPRLLEGETSTGWLGKTVCFKFSCRDGLEEPSARGWGSRRGSRLLVPVTHQESVSVIPPVIHAGGSQEGQAQAD